MNINEFETHVDQADLWEGFSYYRIGVLEEVVKTAKGQWNASVRGSGHKVHVQVANDIIASVSCSCPEKSEYCPDIIATMYTIRYGAYDPNNTDIIVPQKAKRPKVPKTKPEKLPMPPKVPLMEFFNKFMDKIPEKEIREFLVAHAAEDHDFRNIFKAHFIQYNAVRRRQHFLEIADRSLQALWGTDYRNEDIRKALKPVKRLLAHAREVFNSGDYELVVSICLTVIEKLGHFKHTIMGGDTRAGTGDCITEAFNLLGEVSKKELSEETNMDIFADIFASACESRDRNESFQNDWKKPLTMLANNGKMYEMIERWIEGTIWSTRY